MAHESPHYQGTRQLPSLPEKWEYMRLKNISQTSPSSVDKKTKEGEPAVKLCNYTDVYYNEVIDGEIDFMEATTSEKNITDYTLKSGDILLTKDSESKDDIGVPAFVPETLPGVLCGYHLFHVKPDKSIVFPKYLYWSFLSETSTFQLERSAKGVTRFGIPTYAITDTYIPIPPLDTQRAISAFLEEQSETIAAPQERLGTEIGVLQEKRKALITKAVTGQINLNDKLPSDA
jgi:type I restriction enzyme S subunit